MLWSGNQQGKKKRLHNFNVVLIKKKKKKLAK